MVFKKGVKYWSFDKGGTLCCMKGTIPKKSFFSLLDQPSNKDRSIGHLVRFELTSNGFLEEIA